MAHVEKILRQRADAAKAAYEAQWDNGAGSHHPDYGVLSSIVDITPLAPHVAMITYAHLCITMNTTPLKAMPHTLHPDPYAVGEHVQKASRATEEMYLAITKDDVSALYDAIEDGADVNFLFGPAYKCLPGYTPLMVAAHRNHLQCATALLRAGADPNMTNRYGDHPLFWAIDGTLDLGDGVSVLHQQQQE